MPTWIRPTPLVSCSLTVAPPPDPTYPAAERGAGSDGPLAHDAGPFHDTHGGPVVGAGEVLHRPVVPEGDRVRLPREAALVFDGVGLTAQPVDQGDAVLAVETDDVIGEVAVDVDQLAPRLPMGAHDRMDGGREGGPCLLAVLRLHH